jgi:hypothetical protein
MKETPNLRTEENERRKIRREKRKEEKKEIPTPKGSEDCPNWSAAAFCFRRRRKRIRAKR